MITKFLYELDVKERKVIRAVVEDDSITVYDSGKTFLFQDYETYKPQDNEILTENFGDYYFVVFDADGVKKYLDIDTFGGKVKISLTDKMAHASAISKEMIAVILDYTDYFGLEDCKEIPSFTGKKKNGMHTDAFNNYFKKVTDNCYCQLKKEDKNYFLGHDGKDYIWVEDFAKAVKVHKNDMRRVLVINEMLDKKTNRKDLSFSPFDCFRTETSYTYGASANLKINFIDNVLTINRNASIDILDSLANDEVVATKIKAVYFMLNNPMTNEKYLLECNGKYIIKDGNDYIMQDDPAKATYLDDAEIDVFKAALGIFKNKISLRKFTSGTFCIYEEQENIYHLAENLKDGAKGTIITYKTFEMFNDNIFNGFNSKTRKTGNLIIKDGKYLSFEVLEKNKFSMKWLESAIFATLLTDGECDTLYQAFKWDVLKREVKNFVENKAKYNISNEKPKLLIDQYQDILDRIIIGKHRMCFFANNTLKVESEKGSLEYLRRHFIKDVKDVSKIFEMVLSNHDLKHILVVGATSNIELIALNEVANKKIKISTIDNVKWGYYAKANLNNNICYAEHFRLGIENLPISILKQYDMILFSKGTNSIPNEFFDDFMRTDLNIIMVDLQACNMEKKTDYVYEYFKKYVNLKRKYFKHDVDILNNSISFSNKTMEVMKFSVCKCWKKECDVIEPIVGNEYSYHSIFKKNNNKIFDLF